MTTPANTNTSLDAIVREQTTLLRALVAMSASQNAAVTRRDADALDAVLDERQTLIGNLAAVSAQISARSAELERLAASVPAIATCLAETVNLWATLTAADATDMAALKTQRDELAGELSSLNRTGRAAGAYAAPTGRAFFQDTEA